MLVEKKKAGTELKVVAAIVILFAVAARVEKKPVLVAQAVDSKTNKTTISSIAYDAKMSRGNVDRDESDITKINKNLGGVLKGQATNIVKYSRQYNVNARLVTAIILHETGFGDSVAVKRYNNVGGLMGNNGLMKFKSLEYSIEYMCMNLKELYINKGLNNIDTIGEKYCPVGADNDPTGLNKHWIPRVTELYKQINNTEVQS